ncbi:MAG: insulinase family protein, partial [Verrucomicrobiales bacterium]|nr:insulinase family protein [Verrucomicrobiales bacterium]
MNQTILIPALTLALTVSGCGSKHDQSTADRHPGKNSTAMNITKTTLPNGLTVIVNEDHSAPVASVQAWCAAGSITEGRYLGAGISHILEHMLFKGTARRGNSEIALTVQNAGGYVNAYTTFDRTVYHINLPSANWRTAADVLADAMFHSTLPVTEYAKEQEVIRREFAMGEDDPDRALSHLLFATAYTVHPYQYPVIGHLAVYNQLTRDDVLAYYRRYYLPNNITFIVSGDVNAGEVVEFLRQATADVPRGAFEPGYIAPEPPQLGARDAEQTFSTDVTRLALAWHIPAITDPDVYALDVLAVIAGDGASSRFHRALVEEKKLLREVGVFSFTPAQAGLWCVSATLLPDAPVTAAQAREEILQLIAQLQTTAVSAAELEKARRKAVVTRAAELKTVSGQAGSIGSGWFAARDVNFAENSLRRLREVTISDVQRVAQKYLTPDNRTVVTLLPENSV